MGPVLLDGGRLKSALITVVALACATLCAAPTASGKSRWEERTDWGKYFSRAGVKGSFLLYDPAADTYAVYNPERARARYSPASTFKVFNSLVALEVGAVRDVEEVLPWDGVRRGIAGKDIDAWNKDQSMREAFRNSTVWFYQEMARRAGAKRMRHYLNRAGYGNVDMGGGIDRFWLDGRLRISSVEQIDFLFRLYRNDLPFSRRSIEAVKDIFVVERAEHYVLRAKTGWAFQYEPQIGWSVGYVEREGHAYFFALNIEVAKEGDLPARTTIVKDILRESKVID